MPRRLALVSWIVFGATLSSTMGCGANPGPSASPSPTRLSAAPSAAPAFPTRTLVPTATITPPSIRLPVTPLPSRTAPKDSEGRLAFVSTRDGRQVIYVMDAHGTNLVRITSIKEDHRDPAWSPDGRQLACVTLRTDGNSALRFSKIHILNADGTADRILFDDDSEDMDPDWSPNGKKIAYSRNGIIYAANVDGTGAQELAFDPSARLYAPRWSPDGSRIAYSAETRADARATTSRPGDTFIYIVTAQGYGRRELTAGDQAAWSPDGEQLAVRVRSGTSSNLYVVHADGSGLSRVTTGPQLDSDPDWSPDSSRIAFASTRDGNAEIYLVNSDGTKPTRLTRHTSADTQPAWQP